MNNCTAPTCTLKTVRQGPWFLLRLQVELPQGLPMRDYAKFGFDREFAGLSPRGVPLSVKASVSPAAMTIKRLEFEHSVTRATLICIPCRAGRRPAHNFEKIAEVFPAESAARSA